MGDSCGVVERTLAWISKCGLLIRYEEKSGNYLAQLQLACALLWFRRSVRLAFETASNRNEYDNTESLQCQLPLWCHPFHVHLRGDHERPKMQLLHLHPERGGHVLELLPPIGCRGGR
jgi:hypothetical protein